MAKQVDLDSVLRATSYPIYSTSKPVDFESQRQSQSQSHFFSKSSIDESGFRSTKDPEFPLYPYFVWFSSKEERELAIQRYMCDRDIDPSDVGLGTGCTRYDVDGNPIIRNVAEAALKVYNEKQLKKFNLDKVVKVNTFSSSSYLTFSALSAESDDHCLFRAVVSPLGLGGYNVRLCEIKVDEKITIPADHTVTCPVGSVGSKSEVDQSRPHGADNLAGGCAGW